MRSFRHVKDHLVAFLRTDDFGMIRTGGSFTHVRGFTEGMQAHGWNLFFIAAAPPITMSDKNEFYEIPYPKNFNAPEVPEIWYGFRFLRKSYALLKKKKPAFLYHRHSAFHGSTGVLARLLKIPLILEYNGSEAWVKEKWGRLFLRNLCYAFEKVALRGADRIIVVSDVLRDSLITQGVPDQKIVVNPNGVDTDQFKPALDGSEIRQKYHLEKKIVVGFIGSFGHWHGVEMLVQSIKHALEKNSHLHFLIIGDGALRPYVEQIIHDDRVTHAVTLTGTIPHTASPQYLAACDIFVSPHIRNIDGSRFFGSPTKLFEYMAMGKPIIASDLEQIGQILGHNTTAILVEPGNVEALSEAIIKLAANRELCKSLGANAREKVLAEYTWKHNAKRVIKAYESL